MTIIDRPTLGATYQLYGDASGVGMSFQNLKRNIDVYKKDLIDLRQYYTIISELYPDQHANYSTHLELTTADINTNPVQNKVAGTTIDEAKSSVDSTVQNIEFVKEEVLNINSKVEEDFQKLNLNIINLNKKINDLEKKIKPLKKKILNLKSGVATSEGMLDDAQLIYNERITATCLLGILTVGSVVAIYKNWRSMKT